MTEQSIYSVRLAWQADDEVGIAIRNLKAPTERVAIRKAFRTQQARLRHLFPDAKYRGIDLVSADILVSHE